MTPAAASLLALLAAIAISCTSRINVGLLAIVLAWLVGIYAGRVDLVTAGFPSQLNESTICSYGRDSGRAAHAGVQAKRVVWGEFTMYAAKSGPRWRRQLVSNVVDR